MLTRKTATVDGTVLPAYQRFDIDPVDDIIDCASGIVGCLEGESINCVAGEPETIIIIRTESVNMRGDRMFQATVYNGATIPQLIEDLQKQV